MRSARLGAGAALFVLITVLVGVGCSQSPTHGSPSTEGNTSSTEQAIQGGSADGTTHPFAVGVCDGPKGNCQGYCSGALILPNVVVTARHCVDHTTKIINCAQQPTFGARHTEMWVTTSPDMMQGSTGWHPVKAVSVPTDDHVCGHDIAVLILNDLVPANEATPATPGVQYPMTDYDRYPSRRTTAIGYGNTGPNGFSAGTRRIRTSIPLLCIPGDEFISCPTDFNENEFYTGDGPCEGDSGSSAFEDKSVVQGKPLTFGVLSRGGDNAGDAGQPATLCKGGLYTRLDKYRDLIVNAAASASKNWTLYPKPVPDWTIYVPPPPDAGAPEAGPKKPTPQDDGVACDTSADCKSKVCADTGAGKACTQSCDETVVPTTCQDGFVCKAAVCVQDLGGTPVAAAPSTAQSATTSGCSVAGPGSSGSPRAPGPLRMLAIAAAGALILGARRSRRSGSTSR
jgi:hypothetical protein